MNAETSRPRFQELFAQHTGKISDKWEQFLDIYERELGPMVARGMPLHLLEIGIQNGGSLEIWHKYLPDGSRLVGLDIDPRCAGLEMPPTVEIMTADVSNEKVVSDLLGDSCFDIIIDDGSHQQKDMQTAFRTLFRRLKPGGKYFIEDTHACYWISHGGGFRTPGSMMESLKKIVDALHVDYFFDTLPVGIFDDDETAEIAELRDFDTEISSIAFYDSLVAIEKNLRPKQNRFKRVITGQSMQVTDPRTLAQIAAQNPQAFRFFGSSFQSIASAALATSERDARERAAELAAVQEQLAAFKDTIDRLSQAQIAEQTRIEALTADNQALLAALEARCKAAVDADQPGDGITTTIATDDRPIPPVQAELHE